ncbi:MAG: hypothetical protein JO042_05385 [Sinobacteraceae bacterium]|nr:hypothetical protein [Nevskiaceae bacterium]
MCRTSRAALYGAVACVGGVLFSPTIGFSIGAGQGEGAHDCAPSGGLRFVCGAEHPEDLAHIPATPWLIASGFSDGAGLKLVDTRNDTLRRWYVGSPQQVQEDIRAYPDCRAAPDPAVFNAHGISLRAAGGGLYTLYVVNHGGRESIEIFTVDPRVPEPSLVWKGCAMLPTGMAANSVAAFRDGTILATVLTMPGTSITDFVAGKKTGVVLAHRPGASAFEVIRGTELPGNNGLETSHDDKEFYVVAFGWHAVMVFSRADPHKAMRQAVAPGFMPDNIHWDEDRLIAAGMQLDEPACGGPRKIVNGRADDMHCHRGYTVAQLDPLTLQFNILAYSEPNPDFNGVSAAVIVDSELWLGSYQADRLAHRPLPGLAATSN